MTHLISVIKQILLISIKLILTVKSKYQFKIN